MAIIFSNKGEIDLRAIFTFGWHVKETANPIGAFGTGSRYAIATLLRLGCKVVLYKGLEKYIFGIKKVTSRADSVFDLAVMTTPSGEEKELPFTSHLGKNWVGWEAFRELHSNALDEGGTSYRADSYIPLPNQTAFVVEGDAIEKAFDERHKIFLASKPFLFNSEIEVHHGRSDFIYYRGVRVSKLSCQSLFTYNLKSLQSGLTEDRTLKSESDAFLRISNLIADTDHEGYLNEVLVAGDDTYEYGIPSWWAARPAGAFEKVFESLRQQGRAAALTGLANAAWKLKHKELPLPDPVKPTKIQSRQLEKAINFCVKLGYPVNEYPIVIVPEARDGLLALAENNKIILTVGCFNGGTKKVVHGLIEEWMHLKHGYSDCSHAFQTYLFEQLVTMGERVLDEAL